jgi:2-polyprenyl-3-methyl-5-hydroxy-6-metoxy-1,4-benzoquinol methylase
MIKEKFFFKKELPTNPTRDDIGNFFCKGTGLEIGAGLSPTKVSKASTVDYFDKRNRDELNIYFDSPSTLDVKDMSMAKSKKYDFLIAHHVLEHSANVIETLIEWMDLLKEDGLIYLSVPNKDMTPDNQRLLTTPSHFIFDYILKINENDFESRERINSFLWGWIDTAGLEGKTKIEASEPVQRALNSDENDLHWHTFNLTTFKFVIKLAAKFSGRSLNIEFEQEGSECGEHRLIISLNKKLKKSDSRIKQLIDIREVFRGVVDHLVADELEGAVTYSLSKEHKGKLFVVESGKYRWITSPKILEEKKLHLNDRTFVESHSIETLGDPIIDPVINRSQEILNRLKNYKKCIGVELSPGAAPVINKSDFNVIYLDKFDHHKKSSYLEGVPLKVDIVLGEKLIDEVLGHHKYDYLFSSHVIEHIPDFIQFFVSASNILKKNARLLMYVPDKRYTFDVLRNVTSIENIEKAHLDKLRFPSKFMALDFYSNVDFDASCQNLWNDSYKPKPMRTFAEASVLVNSLNLCNEDIHCSVFTPDSSRILINYIAKKYIPRLKILEITQTPIGTNEFIIDLEFI